MPEKSYKKNQNFEIKTEPWLIIIKSEKPDFQGKNRALVAYNQVWKTMVSNDNIYNGFCYPKYINCYLYRFVIYHFCQVVHNDKDRVIATALLIGKYR